MDSDDLESPSLESPLTSPEESDTASPILETSPPTQPLSPSRSMSQSAAPTVSNMTASSTPLGTLNAARGKPPSAAASLSARGGATPMNADIMAKMKAFSVSRQGPAAAGSAQANRAPQSPAPGTPGAPGGAPTAGTGFPAGFKLPPQLTRPNSTPAVPGVGKAPAGRGPSLAEKRGLKLPGGLPGSPAASSPAPPPAASAGPGAGGIAGRRPKPSMKLSDIGGGAAAQTNGSPNGVTSQPAPEKKEQSQMDKYAEYIDTKSGALKFKGRAVVHGHGIDFTDGRSFSISLDECDTLDELGKGNYGTVYKVRHARPKFRKTGQGLAGTKARGSLREDDGENSPNSPTRNQFDVPNPQAIHKGGPTGIVMAMKEIRLELDDAKFAAIIMELDILHRCISPQIVDFYGAFFQEGAVYICMEYMDGGSVDRLYGDGVPEGVLRKITYGAVCGLKSLKEEHNIIHRDVKPTNILVSSSGKVKICDFGVSGNLVASIARTNIGCQSYMAPERISSGGMAQAGAQSGGTYSVQSDIWSLGLTIIECAMGRYPYPPETYDNIFSQLSAIVDGQPPDLPEEGFGVESRDFVAGCLNKIPKLRPSYPMLLQHAWLAPLAKPHTIMEEDEEAAEAAANGEVPPANPDQADGFVDREVGEWVITSLDRRKRGVMGKAAKPALHAAPLDAVGSPQEGGVVAVDA